ncbi:hypothetical protein CHUAL_000321 [Chamberlinius hualienensis]
METNEESANELYRQPWESDEEWLVKSHFIERHKDSLPEDELLCMAQVFINMEFLGCSYPEEVSKKVQEMGNGIMGDIRKIIPKNQGVSFVKAKDDDDDHRESFKGDKNRSRLELPTPKRRRNESPPEYSKPANRSNAASYFNANESNYSSQSANVVNTYQLQNYYTSNYKSVQESAGQSLGSGVPSNSGIKDKPRERNAPSNSRNSANDADVSGELSYKIFGRLVLHMHNISKSLYPNAVQYLNTCAMKAQMTIEPVTTSLTPLLHECKVYINSIVIASGTARSKKIARHIAYELAVNRLFSLTVKTRSWPNALMGLMCYLRMKLAKKPDENPINLLNSTVDELNVTLDKQIYRNKNEKDDKHGLFIGKIYIEGILVATSEQQKRQLAIGELYKTAVDNLVRGEFNLAQNSDRDEDVVPISVAPEPIVSHELNQNIGSSQKVRKARKPKIAEKNKQLSPQNTGTVGLAPASTIKDFVIIRSQQMQESAFQVLDVSAPANKKALKYKFTQPGASDKNFRLDLKPERCQNSRGH